MQNKLQELTDRLYEEGLSKGKEEGQRILEAARAEAEKIIADAKAKAGQTVAKAEKDAAALASKASSDVKMASEQSLQATKKDIENILLSAITSDKISAALSDRDIMKETILAVAKGFAAEPADISLVLPESLKADLEAWAGKELAATIGKGVEAGFSKKIAGGFTIGPKDGSYFVSLTDETFKDLICEYLRPVTKKLLFGE